VDIDHNHCNCSTKVTLLSERSVQIDGYISVFQDFTLFVTLASVFIVLVVTLMKIVGRAAFFQGRTAVLMAVALSVLFLVALSQFLVSPGQVYHGAGPVGGIKAVTHGSLLAGVALGIAAAVMLSQVLLLASRISPGEKSESRATKTDHPLLVAKRRGRRKKEQADVPLAKPKPQGRHKREKLA
jgi:hypothetical protein